MLPRTLLGLVVAGLALIGTARAADPKDQPKADGDGFISLFNGKDLTGWKVVEFPGKKTKWEVVEGELRGSGEASQIVNTSGPYKNFVYRAKVKINDKGNSGLYFRQREPFGWSDGYEAQIDATHADPIRTGSIYGLLHIFKAPAPPDMWFDYEVECVDKDWRGKVVTFITVKINNEVLFTLLDYNRTHKDGHFGFQQHDPGSRVAVKEMRVKPLKD